MYDCSKDQAYEILNGYINVVKESIEQMRSEFKASQLRNADIRDDYDVIVGRMMVICNDLISSMEEITFK